MGNRPYIPIYDSFIDVGNTLPDAERLAFWDALINYSRSRTPFPDDLPPVVANYLRLMKPSIDAAETRYNSASKAGKKSGESRGIRNAEPNPQTK